MVVHREKKTMTEHFGAITVVRKSVVTVVSKTIVSKTVVSITVVTVVSKTVLTVFLK
jgi:hypothetical protein